MIVHDLLEKIKPFYTLLLIVVIAAIFFALGRLSALEERHVPVRIYSGGMPEAQASGTVLNVTADAGIGQTAAVAQSASQTSGEVIGSKSGKKYYYPWCGTVQRIKPENQVHFDSISAARAAGFTPGGNCKGLK